MASLLLSGFVSAANSRDVYLGSPDAKANAGTLLPSPVSVPSADASQNATLVLVQFKSTDNQTIAHVIVKVNWNASGNAGLSLNSFYNADTELPQPGCTTAGTVITCNYGNIAAKGVRTLAVVVNVDSTFNDTSQAQPLFSASAMTNNENGSNQQLFLADSKGFAVSAFSPDNVLTFAGPNSSNDLFTSPIGGTNKLQSKVDFQTAKGKIVSITEGTSTNVLYKCPSGLSQTCQSAYSQVTAGDGSFPNNPYFTWTLTAVVPNTYNKQKGYVIHYPTGAKDSDWILLFKDQSSMCGTNLDAKIAAQGHCISALNLTKIDNSSQKLVVTVIMDHQGGLKY